MVASDLGAQRRGERIGRRKAWLFSDPAGAEASARLYSLIETAKAGGLVAGAYGALLAEDTAVAASAPR